MNTVQIRVIIPEYVKGALLNSLKTKSNVLNAFFGPNRPAFRSKVGHPSGAERPPRIGAVPDNAMS